VSSDRQAAGGSITAQERAFRDWAEHTGDVEIVASFRAEGESASRGKRTEFNRFLEFVTDPANEIELVLVWDISRFSRQTLEALAAEKQLREAGVTLLSVSSPLDYQTPEGLLGLETQAAHAAYLARKIGQGVMMGKEEAVRRGSRPGGRPPYGYRIDHVPDPRGGRSRSVLVPEPKEAKVVRQIWAWATDHQMGALKICFRLNTEGVTTRSGKAWHRAAVLRILRNPVYCGHLQHGDQIIKHAHPALIDQEAWESREDIVDERRTQPRRNPEVYLLTGKLRCGICGGPMAGAVRPRRLKSGVKHYRYYKCSNRRHCGPAVCSITWTIRADWAEDAVLELVRDKILQPEALKTLREKCLEIMESDSREKDIVRDIDRLQREHRNVIAAIRAGGPVEQLNPALAEIAAAIEQAQIKLAKTRAHVANREQVNNYFRDIGKLATRARKAWGSLSAQVKMLLIRAFVYEVKALDPDRIRAKVGVEPGVFEGGTMRPSWSTLKRS